MNCLGNGQTEDTNSLYSITIKNKEATTTDEVVAILICRLRQITLATFLYIDVTIGSQNFSLSFLSSNVTKGLYENTGPCHVCFVIVRPGLNGNFVFTIGCLTAGKKRGILTNQEVMIYGNRVNSGRRRHARDLYGGGAG